MFTSNVSREHSSARSHTPHADVTHHPLLSLLRTKPAQAMPRPGVKLVPLYQAHRGNLNPGTFIFASPADLQQLRVSCRVLMPSLCYSLQQQKESVVVQYECLSYSVHILELKALKTPNYRSLNAKSIFQNLPLLSCSVINHKQNTFYSASV